MTPERLAIRASLDLRGVRPTAEELASVEQDPAALEGLIDAWMQDERFAGRVADLYQEVFLTRNDSYLISAASYGLADQAAFTAAVGEEVPRIIGRIAAEDLPWTEVVLGDWTMADGTLGGIWPIEGAGSAPGEWRAARYTDGRPAAGVLATNSLWWRYTSTDSNANRKRANAISRTLLCHDYLARPIAFDRNVNLLDEAAVDDALHSNPGCVNCHQSLDPIASYLFGFWWFDYTNPGEASYYFPEREQRWQDYTGAAPAWYGTPGAGLAGLGRQIAADPRFVDCAVEHAWELLLRRDVSVEDTEALIPHRNAFLRGGLTLRSLFRSILSDPRYRGAQGDEQGGEQGGEQEAEGATVSKLVTPELMASQIEDLTGFRWRYGGYDMIRTDSPGLLTLAGGADGYAVTAPATGPNTTSLLVQERLAEAAAWHMVGTAPERLLSVELEATPAEDPAAFTAQIQALHWRLFGRRVAAEGEEVGSARELWEGLYAIHGSGAEAWAGLVSALLRDPDMAIY